MRFYRFLFLLVVFIPSELFSQMPGWLTITDKDRNRYFVDDSVKIMATGDPEPELKAVAFEGAEFYLEQGKALYKNHHKVEGVQMLKSLKLLSDYDERAYRYGFEASKFLNSIIRNEGARFEGISAEAAVLIFRKSGRTFVYNDTFRYSFSLMSEISILKRNTKRTHSERGDSVMFGIGRVGNGFNAIVTVSCSEYNFNLNLAESYREYLVNLNGADSFKRNSVAKELKREFSSFTDSLPDKTFSGFEVLQVEGNRGYLFRVITSEGLFGSDEKFFRDIAESFMVGDIRA